MEKINDLDVKTFKCEKCNEECFYVDWMNMGEWSHICPMEEAKYAKIKWKM